MTLHRSWLRFARLPSIPSFAAALHGAALLAALWGAASPAVAEMCAPPLPKPSAALLASAQAQANNHGFLWRISKGGHNSYLYGTLHVGKLEWMFPGRELNNALQASTRIALEINVRDATLMRQLQAGMAAGTVAPLDAALQQRMAQQARRNCVPLVGLERVRPEFQITALTLAAARMRGLEADYSSESVLSSYAATSQKPVESLESVDEQLQSFLASDADDLQHFVDEGLTDLESGDATQLLATLAEVWAASDLQQLNNYALWCNCLKTESDKAAMTRLLDDRNPVLAHRIDRLHAAGETVFAAIGALHMIGAAGVPERLRRMGYQVQRIF